MRKEEEKGGGKVEKIEVGEKKKVCPTMQLTWYRHGSRCLFLQNFMQHQFQHMREIGKM